MAKNPRPVFVRVTIRHRVFSDNRFVIKSTKGPRKCICRGKCKHDYFKTRQAFFGKTERLYFAVRKEGVCWNGVGHVTEKKELQGLIKKHDLKNVKIVPYKLRSNTVEPMPKEDYKNMVRNAKRVLKASKKKGGMYEVYQVEKIEKIDYQKAIKTPLYGKG